MATLKISDLSVGDWVGVRCGTKINAFKVEEIRFNNIIHKYVALLNNKSYGLPTPELHPIPITAEILEKNGWRILEKEVLGEDYEYEGGERVWDDENCSIEICEEKQGVFWYSWSNEYYMWRLEYVHQLQHLIRLAGVDKEINL